jgi:hypothetical protein
MMQRDLPKLPTERPFREAFSIYLDRFIILAFSTILSIYVLGTVLEFTTGAHVLSPFGLTQELTIPNIIARSAFGVASLVMGYFFFFRSYPEIRIRIFSLLLMFYVGSGLGLQAGQWIDGWLMNYATYEAMKDTAIWKITIMILVFFGIPGLIITLQKRGITDTSYLFLLSAFLGTTLLQLMY